MLAKDLLGFAGTPVILDGNDDVPGSQAFIQVDGLCFIHLQVPEGTDQTGAEAPSGYRRRDDSDSERPPDSGDGQRRSSP